MSRVQSTSIILRECRWGFDKKLEYADILDSDIGSFHIIIIHMAR